MRIGIVGYGKMGRAIESMAKEMGHEITWIKSSAVQWQQIEYLNHVDVAIEFSTPKSAVDNIQFLLANKIPVICGTTGWLNDWEKVVSICEEIEGSLLYASNFSIGVNILFRINRLLADLSNLLENHTISINETHHIHKKDKPSGTALSLAGDIFANNQQYDTWHLSDESGMAGSISIHSEREGEIIGIHEVVLKTETDRITIRHEALNRVGFVSGVLLAAAWIQGKKGVFSMDDLITDMQNKRN